MLPKQQNLERATGIEPASSAWKAEVLPLNYARASQRRQTLANRSARCKSVIDMNAAKAGHSDQFDKDDGRRRRIIRRSAPHPSGQHALRVVRRSFAAPSNLYRFENLLDASSPVAIDSCRYYFPNLVMVEGGGFEPPKAEPTDLQSVPFDRLGIPPQSSDVFWQLRRDCQPLISQPVGLQR